MHILIIPSWYKNKEHLNLGCFFEDHAQMLLSHGHKVKIFYPFSSYDLVENIQLIKEIDQGLECWRSGIKAPRYSPRVSNSIKNVDLILTHFEEYLKLHGNPDIVHCHSVYPAGIIANRIYELHKIPYVITEHLATLVEYQKSVLSKVIYYLKIGINKRKIEKAFLGASKIISVGTKLKSNLINKFNLSPDNIIVVPNMLPNQMFNNLISLEKEKIFQIIFIGGLTWEKNISLLLNSVKIIANKINFKLLIIGSGALEKKLKSKTLKLGLNGFVEFKGQILRKKVNYFLQKSHVLVSTSIMESFGVAIIEALANGIPVIATDSGGPRDIIGPGDGIIVSELKPEAVAAAILKLKKEYSAFKPMEIRSRCKSRFSADELYLKLKIVYLESINSIRKK